jgi:hypothetical protein
MVISPSPLDAQRRLIAELRAQLEREELILEGMQRMVAFTGVRRREVSGYPSTPSTSTRGRQPGAISQRWRDILRELVLAGNRFGDELVVATVSRLEQRDMRRSEVRRLFEAHRANGIVEFNEDGSYSVTQKGIEKFDLCREIESPNRNSEGLSMGVVAERLNAPDYESGEGTGGRAANEASQKPSVGSNPTDAAPTRQFGPNPLLP